jgi:hypothetical protein
MKTYGRVRVYLHVFLISTLEGVEFSTHRPGRFTPGERALVPKNSSAFENGYRIYEIYATKKPEFHLKYSKK